MFCGGLVLAIMILPIITAISRDVLKTVPALKSKAPWRLGATWWQSSWEMLHYTRSALFGAVMLGLARAAGETMAITMVIGNNNQIHRSIFAPAQSMTSLLANEFAEASSSLHRAALTEVALILLVMSLMFNIVARWLVVGGSRPVCRRPLIRLRLDHERTCCPSGSPAPAAVPPVSRDSIGFDASRVRRVSPSASWPFWRSSRSICWSTA